MASGEDLNPKGAAGRAKPQLHLIPVGALSPVARVMELGARKYGPYNWRETPVNYTTYLSAIGRHSAALLDGQDQDPESGQSHLAHAAATALILLDAIVTGNAKDDRPPKNPAYVAPEPVFPLKGGEWAPSVPCQCTECVRLRAIKPRLSAEKPTDSGAQDGPSAGGPTAPKL